jgi:DNA-binding MarR family transcriptional regulator
MPKQVSAIQREIRQARPFRSPGHEAIVTLIRTTARLERRFAEVIAPEGISSQQYNVLRILRGAGADGLPTLAIRDRLVDLSPGITRLVDALEREGLLTRDRGGADRRKVVCRITAKGRALLERLDPVVDQAEREFVAPLSAVEIRGLISALDALRGGVGTG